MDLNKPKILAIIPARGGSKRVPNKNFRDFAGTTLTDLAIKQAVESTLVNKIVINSDSELAEKITERYKYDKIEFLRRPDELATDTSIAIDYIIQTILFYEKKGERFDLIVIIQPSSPLRTGLDIDATIRLVLENADADSAVSVVRVPHMIHPHKIKKMKGDVLLPWLVEEGQKTSEHELPKLYVRNGAVYVFRVNNIINKITYGDKSLGYVMNSENSIDINSIIDFDFAEYLFLKIK